MVLACKNHCLDRHSPPSLSFNGKFNEDASPANLLALLCKVAFNYSCDLLWFGKLVLRH